MLVVLDGFGIGSRPAADAIAAARMPVWRGLLEEWPHARLAASGEAVGLPAGQMGNSEVGHLNLGAGQRVLQDLPRIDEALADGSFEHNPALLNACRRGTEPGRRLHLIGLIGPGGVHSNDRHAIAIAALARQIGARDVVVHALLDGRDTPPRSADGFMADFERRLATAHAGARIVTVGGRYYGMDRDQRWERTQKAYAAIVRGEGLAAPSAAAAIAEAYKRGENDEFVVPTVIAGIDGTVRDGDAVIHFNFRADRGRQLIHALTAGPDFDSSAFARCRRPIELVVVTLTEYEQGLPVEVAFPPLIVDGLAAYFSRLGWRQFHLAETEKYAHVTYFFNGGVEAPFAGESRLLVASPKVATYDQQPQMSAGGVTDALAAAIIGGEYDFIIANYANPDMVGHSGDWAATISALEFIDGCLEQVVSALLAHTDNGLLCITADHGNADELRDAQDRPVTAHSLNPVPLVLVGDAVRGRQLVDGILADVAPTLLQLAGLPIPAQMTGRSLLVG